MNELQSPLGMHDTPCPPIPIKCIFCLQKVKNNGEKEEEKIVCLMIGL